MGKRYAIPLKSVQERAQRPLPQHQIIVHEAVVASGEIPGVVAGARAGARASVRAGLAGLAAAAAFVDGPGPPHARLDVAQEARAARVKRASNGVEAEQPVGVVGARLAGAQHGASCSSSAAARASAAEV